MAILKPDKTTALGGVTVKEYLLTENSFRNFWNGAEMVR